MDQNQYLISTHYFDFDDVTVKALANKLAPAHADATQVTKAFYYFVRDEIRYNPYTFSTNIETLRASHALRQRESYCIPKAVLLGALCRSKGIPTRLGLCDVVNHLSTPEFIAWLGSNLFAMHGYCDIFLNGKWVKATPAFNAGLCHKMGVAPLEFDGSDDSIFQEHNLQGAKYMEYVRDHGIFADVPAELILATIKSHYPKIFLESHPESKTHRSFETDLDEKP